MGARLLSDQGPRDSGLRLQASRGLWIQSQWKMVRRAGHWPPPAACTQHQAPPSQPGLRLTLLLQLIFPKKQLVRGKADWLLLLSQSLGSKKTRIISFPFLIPMSHFSRQMHDTSIIGFEMSADGIMTPCYHLNIVPLQGLCRGEDSSQEGVHQGELLPQRVARVQEQGGGDGDQEQCLQCPG